MARRGNGAQAWFPLPHIEFNAYMFNVFNMKILLHLKMKKMNWKIIIENSGYVAYRGIAQNGHANADIIVKIEEISPVPGPSKKKKIEILKSLQGHHTNSSMKKRKRGLRHV
ncbi:hypothetical protein C0J52_22066 [Blattella germanica]|nr:hypothetical protein C0J52_22066 [Blattella germanica]